MAEETIASPVINEIATLGDGRDITRGYVDSLPLLQTQDKLLVLKSAGDLKIYQQVYSDPKVIACLGQRFSAVTSCPWDVKAGGKKLIDKKAAEFVKQQIDDLTFDAITQKMLSGVFYGYAVGEAIYGLDESAITLKNILVRNRVRFGFAPDKSLRLKTSKQPLGEILPERKFWHFCTGADHDDEPYGLGLAHWLYWPVFFKRSGIKFWLKFLDKFGTPTAHGQYENGTSETEQDKLLNALRQIQNDSAVITPKGMEIALLEATRSGSAGFDQMVEVMDALIAQVILGQTASTQGTPGRLGNDDLQSEVRQDIVKADADLICMSLNATIVRWLTDWNFPGAAYPKVWRQVEEPEDLENTAERDTKIKALGFKPSLAYIKETYGDHWEESNESPEDNSVIPGKEMPGNQVEFSEPGESPTTQLENDLVKHTSTGWQSTVNKLQGIVNNANDLTGLQKQMMVEFADLGEDGLVSVMAAGFALAELRGMSDVVDESEA